MIEFLPSGDLNLMFLVVFLNHISNFSGFLVLINNHDLYVKSILSSVLFFIL